MDIFNFSGALLLLLMCLLSIVIYKLNIPTKRENISKRILKYQAIFAHHHRIHLILCSEQLFNAMFHINQLVGEFGFFGLDAEWCHENGDRQKISLLQIGFPSGDCYLFPLTTMFAENFNGADALQDFVGLLGNRKILKFGVGIDQDVRFLSSDFAITVVGFVDLRNLAVRLSHHNLPTFSLKSFAKHWLGIDYEENNLLAMQSSNWSVKPEELTECQKKYAALDALVGALCPIEYVVRKEGARLGGEDHDSFLPYDVNDAFPDKLRSFCQGITDRKYVGKSTPAKLSSDPFAVISKKIFPSKKHPKIPFRQTPMYTNCLLLAPDNQPLSTVDRKKVEWYVKKGLAEIVQQESPLTIRLKFDPSGRPKDSDDFYLKDKVNQCVVCGAAERYSRKNVIPHEYRRYFPERSKSRKSHDVVLLCSSCHAVCTIYEDQLKAQLEVEYDAPRGSVHVITGKVDRKLAEMKSAAKALMTSQDRIPAERRQVLQNIVKEYLNVSSITDEMLQEAQLIRPTVNTVPMMCHGEVVMKKVLQRGLLYDFERSWREHFLQSMQPAFMPEGWSVVHRHEMLEEAVDVSSI